MTHQLNPNGRATRRWRGAIVCAAVTLAPGVAGAQARDTTSSTGLGPWMAAPFIGSDLEDRARLAQVLGLDSAAGFTARSLSSRLTLPGTRRAAAVELVAPELNVVTNTTYPLSQNDGPLWAGRGLNYLARAGVAGSRGRWRVLLVPEAVWSANHAFPDVEPGRYRPIIDTERYSPYSSPWMQHPFPMDQPVRPGPGPFGRLDPGQSALWYETRSVAVGVSSENEWWGPGVRDALVLTNNAGGFPHAFVRTSRPLRTRAGDFEGRWIAGALSESGYFDYDPNNDTRTLAAATVSFRPRWEPDLTLGFSRAVYATAGSRFAALLRWTDVLQPTRRPNSRPWSDSAFTGGRDQITSAYARWLFPRAGAEVYGELGRAEWPASLRDFLVDPTHTMGYLFGIQAVRPRGSGGALWRFQGEFTFLERSTSYRYRPTESWYTSRAAPQGYTQRGQVLGASIGPGSSHQWLAVDLVAPTWHAGAFAARWRINADHMSVIPFPPGTGSCEYDVALYPGLRGGYRARTVGSIKVEWIFENRLNYLFQNSSGCPRGGSMVDVRNTSVRVWLTRGRFR